MPIFEKKAEKRETREILEIVFDMLVSDTPENRITSTLKQMGLSDTETKSVLKQAKKKYDEFSKSTLSKSVDKLIAGKKTEIVSHLDSKIEEAKKALLLQLDLKILEQKKYADIKAESVLAETNVLKSEFFSFKNNIASRIEGIESVLKIKKQPFPIERLLPIISVILGGILCAYSFLKLGEFFKPGFLLTESFWPVLFNVIIISLGIILIRTGYDFSKK